LIQTKNLTKKYGKINAVDNLNLDVKKGDIFGFLGPNGSGKSTTIFMLTGMIEPTSGEAFIDGISVTKDPLEVKRKTGLLPDNVGFYGHLDARRNLEYFSKIYGLSEEERRQRIKYLLELVGLDDVTTNTQGYSKGMKQRLGIAQALISDPPVLFLDEPTAGLDPQMTHQYREIIRNLNKEGKTIFFSSHILPEVKAICKTLGILIEGHLVAVGTPDEIKKKFIHSDSYTIRVETIEKLPRLAHDDIIDMKTDTNHATIEACSDIRDFISTTLHSRNVRIRTLYCEEPDLEEIFLGSIYGGN